MAILTINENMKEMGFAQLFNEISPEDISDNVFTLMGKDFSVITAGNKEQYNSMVGSGGGMGFVFKKPGIWSIFQQSRYTLELILREQTYTISYFPDEYKKQLMFLGSKTGRGNNKMKEVELTSVKTPSGNITFKEARLIFECKLVQVTTPDFNDFYAQEAKEWINEMYKDPNEIRKYVFGEITHVWIKK
jgi:flavin reductase (DIM6/NTAB) family NADH-FMN oxidoreductase RutF